MRRPTIIATLGTLAILASLPSCTGTPGTLVSLECDCEHCSNIEEDLKYEGAKEKQDVAAAYGCDSEYDSWAQCVEDKGQCDEKELRFSTQEQGSCSDSISIGAQCMTDADCTMFGSDLTCSAMTCHHAACSGTMQECTSNSDCSGGKDRCQSDAEDLAKCIDKASDDPAAGSLFD